ncbi:MAG TPA: DUF4375 domain-containing protein [Gammaproteobacteria bacterium]|nr:DUF4375 domain-containing protein [Gammaproteobacteria bacterium]
MAQKVACKTCGKLILPTTASKNDGLCMPCKNGYRESIEKSKTYYAKERELDKSCPFRALWRELVRKVYDEPNGFDKLSEEEKQYFAVGVLDGEVHNGGIIQFFDNSSGEYYRYAELGLVRIGAKKSLHILRKAKETTFGGDAVPKEQEKRWRYTRDKEVEKALERLDTEYYESQDEIGEMLEAFALESGLIKNA